MRNWLYRGRHRANRFSVRVADLTPRIPAGEPIFWGNFFMRNQVAFLAEGRLAFDGPIEGFITITPPADVLTIPALTGVAE